MDIIDPSIASLDAVSASQARLGQAGATGGGTALSCQTDAAYVKPTWPAGPGDQQMMMHLDIKTEDFAAAGAYALAAGATLAQYQPQDDVRVHLDPAGHPFWGTVQARDRCPTSRQSARTRGTRATGDEFRCALPSQMEQHAAAMWTVSERSGE